MLRASEARFTEGLEVSFSILITTWDREIIRTSTYCQIKQLPITNCQQSQQNIMRAITHLTPPTCTNCLATPCLNNTTIPNTNNMMPGCKVAVKNNNCPDYWGSTPLAQQGNVTKVPSPQMVRVEWCDGSESDYNVYLTNNTADPQLVFHCGAAQT